MAPDPTFERTVASRLRRLHVNAPVGEHGQIGASTVSLERLFNLSLASLMLVMAAPLFLVAALCVPLSSRGPILFRARRVGRGGRPFTMHKFRTMRVHPPGSGPPVTGPRDPRVFRVGAFLRRSKIDELPQLFDVLRGEMAIVGPRPEDPDIVACYYDERQKRTLEVLPGLTSPGALFDYTHGSRYLAGEHVERNYVKKLLPVMLEIELVYVENRSLRYDLWVILRTAATIVRILAGQRDFADPPELRQIRQQRRLPPELVV
jgi:lipopolysaccharide/colanic/teichoic acid biosynthesis glycosyltransferase